MKDIFKYGGLALVVGGAAVLGISAVNMITAPMRAASGVVNRTLDADNVLATYERFHDRWKGYESRLSQIRVTRELMAAETDQAELRRMRIELVAQQQSCRDIASGYNADMTKTNRSIFAGREVPTVLDMEACSR